MPPSSPPQGAVAVMVVIFTVHTHTQTLNFKDPLLLSFSIWLPSPSLQIDYIVLGVTAGLFDNTNKYKLKSITNVTSTTKGRYLVTFEATVKGVLLVPLGVCFSH